MLNRPITSPRTTNTPTIHHLVAPLPSLTVLATTQQEQHHHNEEQIIFPKRWNSSAVAPFTTVHGTATSIEAYALCARCNERQAVERVAVRALQARTRSSHATARVAPQGDLASDSELNFMSMCERCAREQEEVNDRTRDSRATRVMRHVSHLTRSTVDNGCSGKLTDMRNAVSIDFFYIFFELASVHVCSTIDTGNTSHVLLWPYF